MGAVFSGKINLSPFFGPLFLIGSDSDASIKTRVEIDRVFVKTWNSPDYYACEARLSVYVGAAKYTGQSRVKIKRAGQELVHQDLAVLKSETLNAVSLALKAAYIDAFGNIEKTTTLK